MHVRWYGQPNGKLFTVGQTILSSHVNMKGCGCPACASFGGEASTHSWEHMLQGMVWVLGSQGTESQWSQIVKITPQQTPQKATCVYKTNGVIRMFDQPHPYCLPKLHFLAWSESLQVTGISNHEEISARPATVLSSLGVDALSYWLWTSDCLPSHPKQKMEEHYRWWQFINPGHWVITLVPVCLKVFAATGV